MPFIPFTPSIGQWPVNVHLIFEYLAFFIAYRYYVHLRKRSADLISGSNRLSIVLGAALGAFVGSRLIGILENPDFSSPVDWISLYNTKTIMGGLFGGLIGVEITKAIVHEKHSSGDLFTLPLIAGIFIGRIGCFLSGTNEFTYGSPTESLLGMELGDGVNRHPIVLYELVFLMVLYFILRRFYYAAHFESGLIFKMFMVTYFTFRFMIEFLKPNVFFIMGLSTIQWLCVVCLLYYRRTLIRLIRAY